MTALPPTWCHTAEHQKPTCARSRTDISHLRASTGVPHFPCRYTPAGEKSQRHPKLPSWNATPSKVNDTLIMTSLIKDEVLSLQLVLTFSFLTLLP